MTTETAPPPVVAGPDVPVTGRNREPGTLGDQIGDGPAMLVFLRHAGCCFCRQQVRDLRRAAARAVADPGAALFRAFGVARGGLGEMSGPRSCAAAVRAVAGATASAARSATGGSCPPWS